MMWRRDPAEKVEHLDVDVSGRADGDAVVWDATAEQHVYGSSVVRAGWTTVESAHQEGFDAATDAGAILAKYRWGVTAAGVPYFDSAGVTSGEEAALWLDDNDQPVLVELDL